MIRGEIPISEIRACFEKERTDLMARLVDPATDAINTQFIRGHLAMLRDLERILGLVPQKDISEAARRAAGGVTY